MQHFVVPVLAGILIGVFFLLPVNEFVFFYEDTPDIARAVEYTTSQMALPAMASHPVKVIFFAFVGAFLGFVSAVAYSRLYRSTQRIKQLSEELEKDLTALIKHGESGELEFKSTYKWDLKESKSNRGLEEVVIKTIAGFMNGEGGTLIIGVADNGEILGLESDYRILKKKDRDGFEQALMTAVASHLGTDACQYVQAVFHTIEDKDVCRVLVRKSGRPVYVREGNDSAFYLRTGVSTRSLNVQEAVEYISTRWGR